MTHPPGSRLGPYQIVAQLGAGGMGVVYRARDTRLQRDVALKLLPPGLLVDDSARRRFRKEALALAKLSHPNIAAVYDVGEQDGADYLVMELIPGQSLAARLEAGPLPITEALAIGRQVAAALEEAHEHGVVHRDLKPANVMVTPKGVAKVLDFGIAKLFGPSDSESLTQSVTESGVRAGTLLYMSPEQAFGEGVDSRTDLWSLGVLLYESLAGSTPFHGPGQWAVLRAVSQAAPAPLRMHRPDVPPRVEHLINRALTKDVTQRYQTAAEMGRDTDAALNELTAPVAAPGATTTPRSAMVLVVLLLVVVAGAGLGWYRRSEELRWAREDAIPLITQLRAADQALRAIQVLQRAERDLPGDSALAAVAEGATRVIAVSSTPADAAVEIQDYLGSDSSWYALGRTPLTNVRIPRGYLRWRITPRTGASSILAPLNSDTIHFALDSMRQAGEGMVRVEGGDWGDMIAFLGWVFARLPAFDIDRYEVTNQQYQQFVDQGGYDKPQYWTAPFVDHGKPVSRAEAMPRLRDRTGRPGPSTWEGGHFPVGQANYPVSGVSWYEASAYAAFAGKSLPAYAQWFRAAPGDIIRYIAGASNIGHKAMAPVGSFTGLGPYGTYDMAGNVREWISNPVEGERRLILGGAYDSPSYIYYSPEALSPFDRAPENGIRCVRNLTPLPADVTGPVEALERDFTKVHPASDEVFHAYQILYAYDQRPLNAKVDATVGETPDWRMEKVTFDAAYGERMAAYLFLPRRARAPYQTVVFFPSATVYTEPDSRHLGDMYYIDYIIQSGRAVLYPVYQDTYERRVRRTLPGAAQALSLTVHRYQDVARSIDYLETRSDIDSTRLAYLGASMGAAEGVIYTALQQDRLRAILFLDGGYFLDQPPKGGDQADFAPRIKKPVLMLNGRYDYTFSTESAQKPLFAMLGTPPADKRHVMLEAGHGVYTDRPAMVREVLGWLDKYLGRVE